MKAGGSDRRRKENRMKYSGWTGLLYASSAFRSASETIAGLERKLRILGVEPPPADIRRFADSTPCVPGWSCRVKLRRLEAALAELERTAADAIALGRRIVAEARRAGVDEFDIRLSGPVGPAPDRPAASTPPGGTKPRPKRPRPKRPGPKRPSPRKRAR